MSNHSSTVKGICLIAFIVITTVSLRAQPSYTFTVAQDGSGDFTTIQAAIDGSKAFPDERVTIFIRNGTYYEKVAIPGCNPHLTLTGESTEKTIISFDDFFDRINRGRNSTFYTYTLLIEADDIIIENLTIENRAGRVGQAVALHIEGDRCVVRNCRILGNQDTLYAAGDRSRQYFHKCYIEGTTDFIFGAATVLFDECIIHSRGNSYITAASTPKGKEFGFVFIGCSLTADDSVDRVFLGRPWRAYGKTVFIECDLGKHIAPEGWSNWDKTTHYLTAFYAEYNNSGPGALIAKRVPWSHQLKKKEAEKYSIRNIFAAPLPSEPDAEEWTGVR